MKKQPNGNEVKELRSDLKRLIAEAVLDDGELNVVSIGLPALKLANKMLKYETFALHLRLTDVIWIVAGAILREVSGIEKEKRAQASTLKELIGEAGVSALEDRISDFLRTIPREYFTYWGLPGCKPFGFGNINLAEGIALIEAHPELGLPIRREPAGLFGLGSLLGGDPDLLANMSPGLLADRVYLRVVTKGYASFDFDGIAVRGALSRVKQVIVLGISEGLFDTEHSGINSDFFMHSTKSGAEEQQAPSLPAELSSYLGSVNFTVGAAGIFRLDQKEGPKLVARTFERAKVVLDRPEDDRDATAIRTACEWCFDSLASRNQTLAFLQACIGLEAVLGEHGADESITKRLADRCAYLIGNSIRERNEIRDLFMSVYDVRSKIVHGRRPMLSLNEEKHLDDARGLLKRVIKREVELIQPAGSRGLIAQALISAQMKDPA